MPSTNFSSDAPNGNVLIGLSPSSLPTKISVVECRPGASSHHLLPIKFNGPDLY